ncbi:helix-turn-helix domain-containing protein, partial [Xanthobacter autotrophicus]|uniref:helix-turn-helix domain-containing protein n=2 Tax=Pseudomonadota TaxID=1224 RepID=UPI0024AC2270
MPNSEVPLPDHYTTLETAKLLGMAVRSIQLMVDRGELEAWKTPGGHRRISRDSVERWLRSRE